MSRLFTYLFAGYLFLVLAFGGGGDGTHNLPTEAFIAMESEQMKPLEISTEDEEFLACWFIVKDKDFDDQQLEQEWASIQKDESWYDVYPSLNKALWQEKGLALVCHSLIE